MTQVVIPRHNLAGPETAKRVPTEATDDKGFIIHWKNETCRNWPDLW